MGPSYLREIVFGTADPQRVNAAVLLITTRVDSGATIDPVFRRRKRLRRLTDHLTGGPTEEALRPCIPVRDLAEAIYRDFLCDVKTIGHGVIEVGLE